MNRSILFFALGTVSLVVTAITAEELKVEPDKENVVASRLEGNWQTVESLTQRLTGNVTSRPTSLAFKSDPAVAGLVPDKYANVFAQRGMKIYLAGYVAIDGKGHPFVVTHVHGNAHVLFWLERNGDPFGNGESFNVMLAVAKDKQQDLLFVGGDFNNQPFSAFERTNTDAEK